VHFGIRLPGPRGLHRARPVGESGLARSAQSAAPGNLRSAAGLVVFALDDDHVFSGSSGRAFPRRGAPCRVVGENQRVEIVAAPLVVGPAQRVLARGEGHRRRAGPLEVLPSAGVGQVVERGLGPAVNRQARLPGHVRPAQVFHAVGVERPHGVRPGDRRHDIPLQPVAPAVHRADGLTEAARTDVEESVAMRIGRDVVRRSGADHAPAVDEQGAKVSIRGQTRRQVGTNDLPSPGPEDGDGHAAAEHGRLVGIGDVGNAATRGARVARLEGQRLVGPVHAAPNPDLDRHR